MNAFQNGLEVLILLYLFPLLCGSKRKHNTNGAKHCSFKYCVGKENNVVLVIRFSQHKPFTLMSVIFRTSSLQVPSVVKKQKIVYVKITCGLGSSVSEEYTACVFRRLPEDGGKMFIQKINHTR
jgi:hypothetical protein